MSRPLTSSEKAVIDRLSEVRRALGWEDFAAYAFLTLGILGANSPDVLTFILDRADELTTRERAQT